MRIDYEKFSTNTKQKYKNGRFNIKNDILGKLWRIKRNFGKSKCYLYYFQLIVNDLL